MDSRIIKNVKPFANSKIADLEPVTFIQCNTNKQKIGLVSQEVEKVEPLLINKSLNGIKSIDYENLTICLLSTIKDLKSRIELLEKKGNNLKGKTKGNEDRN